MTRPHSPFDGKRRRPFGLGWPERFLAQAVRNDLLIFGATWTLPQARFYGVAFTGDRLLGLVAVGALVVLALNRRLRWTGVHVALGVSLATQVFTSILNVKGRPQGLKFSAIYLMGFACFALSAECSRRQADRRLSVGDGSWWAEL